MKIKLILSLVVSNYLCSAQITFHKTYGSDTTNQGSGRIIQTQDKGYVITGGYQGVSPFTFPFDMLMIKIDQYGNTLWTKIFADSLDDELNAIKENTDGSLTVFGNSNSFAPDPGFHDMALIKTDSAGTILWSYHYGGSNHEDAANMMLTDNGNYLMIGNTSTFGNGATWLYVTEADTGGNLLQSHSYGISNGVVTGLAACKSVGNGFVIGANLFDLTVNKNHLYVNKIDSAGNLLWSKTYGGGNSDYFRSITPSTDSGYILCGHSYSFNDTIGGDIYVIKIDSTGNVVWSKTYGYSNQEWAYSIKNTNDGGYILSGHIHSNGQHKGCGLKLDAGGNVLWCRKYGAINQSGFLYDVIQAADSGFIFTGTYFGPVYFKIFVVKTDPSGESGCDESDYNVNGVNVTTTVLPVPTNHATGGNQYPAVFSVNAGLEENTICIYNGENELKNSSADDIVIYPNPSNGNFQLKVKNPISENHSVIIYNSLGEKIYSHKLFLDDGDIFLKEKPGIYFVQVNDGKKMYSKKLVIWCN